MPAAPSHLPTHRERPVLNRLRAGGELPARDFHPIGATTLGTLVRKGWIERRSNDSYAITAAGEVALKAKLPLRSRGFGREALRRSA